MMTFDVHVNKNQHLTLFASDHGDVNNALSALTLIGYICLNKKDSM